MLAVAVFAAFGWTLPGAFLSDDFGYVQRFWHMELRDWPRQFVHELSEGMWGFPLQELRPVTALAFLIDAHVWQGRAIGYHLTNLVLHLLCSGLVMLIAKDVLAHGTAPGLLAGLVFALHPAHSEAVVWITGRADMLGTLGFLGAFYALMRFRVVASGAWLTIAWVAYGAGIFAKEFCLILPPVAIAYDLAFVDRSTRRRSTANTLAPYLGWAVIAIAYYVCRREAFGYGLIAPRSADAPAPYAIPFAQREAIYLAHLFWPLARWLPTGDRQRAMAERLVPSLLAIVLAVTATWCWRDRERGAREAHTALVFGWIWFFAGTLPFVVTYVSPRHLYLASAGLCIALAAVLIRLVPRPAIFAAVSAGLVIACASRVIAAGKPWREASELSREIGDAATRVATAATAGDVLVLDVPGTLGGDCVNCVSCGAWVWAWASPFALRPPFQDHDVTRDLTVLERQEVYFHPEAWSAHPSFERLRGYGGRIWLISTEAGRVTTIEVPADRAVAALGRSGLLAGEPGSFERLVTALKRS